MTTAEVEEKLNDQKKEINSLRKELNKVKSFCTRLSNQLDKNGQQVPFTNWSEENTEEVKADNSAEVDS